MGFDFSLRNSFVGVRDGESADEGLKDQEDGADEDQHGKNGGDEGCRSVGSGWFERFACLFDELRFWKKAI